MQKELFGNILEVTGRNTVVVAIATGANIDAMLLQPKGAYRTPKIGDTVIISHNGIFYECKTISNDLPANIYIDADLKPGDMLYGINTKAYAVIEDETGDVRIKSNGTTINITSDGKISINCTGDFNITANKVKVNGNEVLTKAATIKDGNNATCTIINSGQ